MEKVEAPYRSKHGQWALSTSEQSDTCIHSFHTYKSLAIAMQFHRICSYRAHWRKQILFHFITSLPSLPRSGTCNTRPNNARQLLCSHAVHHPDDPHDQHPHRNAKDREKRKLGADVFLLARGAGPEVRLLAAVFVGTDGGAGAFALEAGFGGAGRLAGAVAAAGVGGVVAGGEGGEAAGEAAGKCGVGFVGCWVGGEV